MKPIITVPEVLPLASAFYYFEGNSVGGSLHIVLDDNNIDDGDLDHCIEYARERGDVKGELLGKILRAMSKTQRGKIAKNHLGYYSSEHAMDAAEFLSRGLALLEKVGCASEPVSEASPPTPERSAEAGETPTEEKDDQGTREGV